jgi:hypothetical protein
MLKKGLLFAEMITSCRSGALHVRMASVVGVFAWSLSPGGGVLRDRLQCLTSAECQGILRAQRAKLLRQAARYSWQERTEHCMFPADSERVIMR